MDWTSQPHRRSAGFVQEILRYQWVHCILTTLAERGPLPYTQIRRHLVGINDHDEHMIGRRSLSAAGVRLKLTDLQAAELVDQIPGVHAGRSNYAPSPLATGMLESLTDVTAWGLTHWTHLVETTRARRGLPLLGPALPPDPADPDAGRVAVDMTLGLFYLRWAFAVLVYCHAAGEPVDAAGIQQLLRAGISPDLAARHLVDSARDETVAYLEHVGLIERTEVPRPGSRPQVLYQPTSRGTELLEAWWRVAEWGLPHDAAMYDIITLHSGRLDG